MSDALSEGSGDSGDVDGDILGLSKRVAEAVAIKDLLEMNTDEVDNLLRALDGSYVKPGVGGEGLKPTGKGPSSCA